MKKYNYFLTIGKKGYYLSLPNNCFSSKREAIAEVKRLFAIREIMGGKNRSWQRGKLIGSCIVRIEKQLLN